MGCSSNRKKQTREFADQKWDYINLQDFKARGCGPGFAYGYLWFMLIISIAVYAVDSFTAVNLLAFNRWSSKIKPTIPFDVSKCIFSVCILLSFVNLAFEGFRAIRVMKRGNVAECFLDSLAVRWESIRCGQGQGWKRFLVFAELTRSKKGSEYVALFTYFSFKCMYAPITHVQPFTLLTTDLYSMGPSHLLLWTSPSSQRPHTKICLPGQACAYRHQCRRRNSRLFRQDQGACLRGLPAGGCSFRHVLYLCRMGLFGPLPVDGCAILRLLPLSLDSAG